MKVFEVIRVWLLTLPLGIFITFGVFILLTCTMKVRKVDVAIRRLLCYYFVCAILSSVLLLVYYYFQEVFIRFDIIYCGSVIFTMLLFYHFLCYATLSENSLSPLHYITSFLVCCVLYIVKVSLPEYWLRDSMTLIFCIILVFAVIYSLLPLMEIHRFYIRQSIANGTSEVIDNFRTVLYILELLMFPIVFGLFPFIGGQNPGVIVSILLMISILAALTMNIPLTYAIIRHYTADERNFSLFNSLIQNRPEIVTEDTYVENMQEKLLKAESKQIKRIYRSYTHRHRSTGQLIEIDKAEFESYFRQHKPYLNPNLTICDLIDPLQSNRTYISKFINRIYGMNFSSYIKKCRLCELERLMAVPGNRHKNPAKFFSLAGFRSYRNYLDAKKQFEAVKNMKDQLK